MPTPAGDSTVFKSSSCLPSSSVSPRSATNSEDTAETDIGKLIEGGVDTRKFTRDHAHKILTHKPNSDSSVHPHICLYGFGSYKQFQPSWLKEHPWFHYSGHHGVFCHACAIFLQHKVDGQRAGQFASLPFKS